MPKLKRHFFDEYTAGCLYHPNPGCVHLAREEQAKFISSLTNTRDDRGRYGLHAPTLDVDYPTKVESLADGKTRVEIIGPMPLRLHLENLLDRLVSTGLMDAADAQTLRSDGPRFEPLPLPALILQVEGHATPSSSPDHFHLYLEQEMSWNAYADLLKDLTAAEIIGRDFRDMCLRWNVSFLLKPGLTKSDLALKFDQAS